jgi:hypothetical protein
MLYDKKSEWKKGFIFLGFHFKVTLESDKNNGQQTRGIFKVKFNQQKEETLLFK